MLVFVCVRARMCVRACHGLACRATTKALLPVTKKSNCKEDCEQAKPTIGPSLALIDEAAWQLIGLSAFESKTIVRVKQVKA